jgi:hypothetical protein
VVVTVTERPEALSELYAEYRAVLETTARPFEFLFIFEPWARPFVEPLIRLADAGEPIRVLESGQSVGESMLLRAAVAHHPAPIIVTVPPYPRVAPESLLELLERVDAGVDLAVARRSVAGESLANRIQRRAFHWLLRRGVGGTFHDVASGVRAMRRSVLEEAPLHGDLYRFLPVLAEREGFRVEEIVVEKHPQTEGSRVYSPGIYLRRLLDLLGLVFLVRFTRKPLRFFGLVGSFFSAIGSLILLVMFVQRLGGRPLADRPLLLLGVLLAVLGVQAVALGLIGEIIVHLDALDRPTYRLHGGVRPSVPKRDST